MRIVLRVLALFVVVPVAGYVAAMLATVVMLPFDHAPAHPFTNWETVVLLAVSLPVAIVVGRAFWKWSAPARLETTAIPAAIAIGGIGLYAGFFGPLILRPDANQGPLLGIFITGPLGFVLGGIGGFLYWRTHEKKH